MRRVALVLAIALTAIPLAACNGGGSGDKYVLEVHGAADVRADGTLEHLTDGRHRLEVGQTVTMRRGSAVLGLPGDASLELRAGHSGSIVEVGPRPKLVDGDVLAVTDDDLTLASGGATFDLHDGAARLRRSVGVTMAVYEGAATVEALGRRLAAPVRALRQVTVTDTGALPRRAVPLVYDRGEPDPWDTRYLNDAIDLGGQLERRVRVLNARPAPPSFNADYLTSVVPALRSARGFRAELVDADRSVGETIVGASIALGGDGELGRRWHGAFDFRRQGADWGLVALDQRARRNAVLGVLNGVLDRVSGTFSPVVTREVLPPPAATKALPPPPTSTSRPGSGSTPTTPTTLTNPTVPTLPPLTIPLLPTPTTSPPSTPRSPTPTILPTPTLPPLDLEPVEGLLDDVGGLVDDVGGLLNGLLDVKGNGSNGPKVLGVTVQHGRSRNH